MAPASFTAETVRQLAEEVLAPAHFLLCSGWQLAWRHHPTEETSWELFQGRLLDPAHTRQRRTFEAWSVYRQVDGGLSTEPLLSLKLDAAVGRIFVVRGLECYVHEGYDSGGGVILTREKRQWVRELSGAVELQRFADVADLRAELIGQLFRAVVGTSRLPLHSVEAPLPAFSFGELFYCPGPVSERHCEVREWEGLLGQMLTASLTDVEQAKLLETLLHAVFLAELPNAASAFWARWRELGKHERDFISLLRTLFNEVSLSPWTDLVEKVLGFLNALEGNALATADIIDFLGYLLRQTCRHLTAYDLVTFHYRGANYPDALLLDAVLKAYLGFVTRRQDLFEDTPHEDADLRKVKRLRRRALRQAWLLRRHYEGHPVPDLPTSPGENNRVLPPSHPRVPEEQIVQSSGRKRLLFAGDALPAEPAGAVAKALQQSMNDLKYPEELSELGLGLFIERPFGEGKAPAEPDNTLLLASVAFSRSLAIRRLCFLAKLGLLAEDQADAWREGLEKSSIRGLTLGAIGPSTRPGAMSLSLARQAAADFIFQRTLPGGVAEFLRQFDLSVLSRDHDLAWLTRGDAVLFARALQGPGVQVYDRDYVPRLELETPPQGGFISLAGREFPAGGLRGRWLSEVDSKWIPVPLLPTTV